MPLPLIPEQAELEQSFEIDLSESLGEVNFAEALPESATPEQLDRAAPALIRFLLQSGENGYKDSIDAVTDETGSPPSQPNNWLWNAEEEAFVGRFLDSNVQTTVDRLFQFRIERSAGQWIRSFQPINEGGK